MSKTFVSLTGGLGNQLFQLSAALHIAGDDPVVLIRSYGRPREESPGTPDICGFQLGDQVSLHRETEKGILNLVSSKGVNFTLSSGLQVSKVRSNLFVSSMVRGLTSVTASMDLGSPVIVQGARGIGFDQKLDRNLKHRLLAGYFQSWKYFDREKMSRAVNWPSPKYGLKWFHEMSSLAEVENPLVVHVRLGDYRQAPEFGFPSKTYFDNAVTSLREDHGPQRIWLFSDEPKAALDYLPTWIVKSNPRMIVPPTDSAHPATALAVMALGKSYALTNSTFGYWAASMSGVMGSRICMPDPWFETHSEIQDLADPSWIKITRGETP